MAGTIPVRIVLTVQGANTGPFALYTDLDGYTTAFDDNGGSGIPGAWFVGPTGYLANVPEGTSIIRVCNHSSNLLCDNCIDLYCLSTTTSTTDEPTPTTLPPPTTTTTSTQPLPLPPTTTTTTTADCVLVQFTITQEDLDDATGNSYSDWNNTVFACCVPCGYPIGRRQYEVVVFEEPGYYEFCIERDQISETCGAQFALYYYKNDDVGYNLSYTITDTPCERSIEDYSPKSTTTTSTTALL